jgi:hypothetical protein
MMFGKNQTERFVRDWNALTLGCITPARWAPKVHVKTFAYFKHRASAAEAFCVGDWSFGASS